MALVSSGCGAGADDGSGSAVLTVFAASSLTDAFEELGEEYERRNPGVEVRFNFAGSSMLLAQLRQGAPADVFASADKAKMDAAKDHGVVSGARVFAENSTVVALPEENPAGVEALRDLAKPNLDLVLAQEGVPIAGYAEEVLAKAGTRYGADFGDQVVENVVSREADVRAAANRVAIGEADATFVYASDVTPEIQDEIKVVEVPEEFDVTATYQVSVTGDAPHPAPAREWVDLVLSQKGQNVMEGWEFERVN